MSASREPVTMVLVSSSGSIPSALALLSSTLLTSSEYSFFRSSVSSVDGAIEDEASGGSRLSLAVVVKR